MNWMFDPFQFPLDAYREMFCQDPARNWPWSLPPDWHWDYPWFNGAPSELLDAMAKEPQIATVHADRWFLLGLLPGEYRVDDTCTLRMVTR